MGWPGWTASLLLLDLVAAGSVGPGLRSPAAPPDAAAGLSTPVPASSPASSASAPPALPPRPGRALRLQLVNLNYESLRLTWDAGAQPGANLTCFYSFVSHDERRPCPQYLLEGGRTAGCVLPPDGDRRLYVSLWDGPRRLLASVRAPGSYLKPRPPGDLRAWWQEDTVTVNCTGLDYEGLRYEAQHKAAHDTEWQSQQKDTCSMDFHGLDVQKCHAFRVRARTLPHTYKEPLHHSDWSAVLLLQGGLPTDACSPDARPAPLPKFVLLPALAALAALALLLLSLWKLHRVQQLLVPSVPDPKSTFPGLFESHRGNFQEWLLDTQNVAPLTKMAPGARESLPEDALLVPLGKAEPAGRAPPRPPSPRAGAQAGTPDPAAPRPGPGEVVSLGGFTFLLHDDAYMVL